MNKFDETHQLSLRRVKNSFLFQDSQIFPVKLILHSRCSSRAAPSGKSSGRAGTSCQGEGGRVNAKEKESQGTPALERQRHDGEELNCSDLVLALLDPPAKRAVRSGLRQIREASGCQLTVDSQTSMAQVTGAVDFMHDVRNRPKCSFQTMER